MERRWIFKIGLACCCLWACFLGAEPPSDKVKAQVAPYLLPDHHPIKPLLDTLFASSRVILNLDTLEQAGFAPSHPRKFTRLVVTRHPAIRGYVFKLYLDAQRYYQNKPEHYFWILRVQGANKIRKEIAQRGAEGLFKVPYKWIYELPPPHSKLPEGYPQKYYILVEEDMQIVSHAENMELWGSNFVTPLLLSHLYEIVTKLGLNDCLKLDNIPFAIDGRVAFIDTQTFGAKHVRCKKFGQNLTASNRTYWEVMTKSRK